MSVGNAKRSVALFIPPPPGEALTNIVNKTDYRQYFDNYANLRNHDRDVHTYCTDCKRAFDGKNELWDHAEGDHHACWVCKEVSHAFSSLHHQTRP